MEGRTKKEGNKKREKEKESREKSEKDEKREKEKDKRQMGGIKKSVGFFVISDLGH